jgi:hypothetical protein
VLANDHQLPDSDDLNSRQQQSLTHDKHAETERLANVSFRIAPLHSVKDPLLHTEMSNLITDKSTGFTNARDEVQVANRAFSNDLSEHLQVERGEDLPLCAVVVQDDNCEHEKSDDFD